MWRRFKRLFPPKAQVIEKVVWVVRWADDHVPVGVRSLFGILLMIGGILSFLPVLGIWMLPAGALLMALDVPPWRRRLLAWLERQEAAARASDNNGDTGEAGTNGPRDG
jgi:hypothetical protein